jgi:hypothetical protein
VGELEPSLAMMASTLVNEVSMPIVCAMLIYIGQLVSHNFTIYKKHSPQAAQMGANAKAQ